MKINVFLLLLMPILVIACSPSGNNTQRDSNIADSLVSAWSLETDVDFQESKLKQDLIEWSLVPEVETDPVGAEKNDDAADDPAIWINSANPAQSRLIGTNKKAGLHLYNLTGEELQFVAAGRINNVDLRSGFVWKKDTLVLVAGSNRDKNSIAIYLYHPKTDSLSNECLSIPTQVDEVYGLCLYAPSEENRFVVWVNGKGGRVEGYEILSADSLDYEFLTAYSFANQPEGMVADDYSKKLYVGVEEDGIYCFGLDSNQLNQPSRFTNSGEENEAISYDIEGLALFSYQSRSFLVASSQGNFSYAVFELGNQPAYRFSFKIEASQTGIDGVEETDGLEIYTGYVSDIFPEGILVVQDGYNFAEDELAPQNFKILSLKGLLGILEEQEL